MPAWSFPVSLICRVLLWRREFTRDTAFCFLLQCYKGAFILKGYPVVSLNLIRPWVHGGRHSWSNWQRYLPLPVSNLGFPFLTRLRVTNCLKTCTHNQCVCVCKWRQTARKLKRFFYSTPTKRGVLDFFFPLRQRARAFQSSKAFEILRGQNTSSGIHFVCSKGFKDMIFFLIWHQSLLESIYSSCSF